MVFKGTGFYISKNKNGVKFLIRNCKDKNKHAGQLCVKSLTVVTPFNKNKSVLNHAIFPPPFNSKGNPKNYTHIVRNELHNHNKLFFKIFTHNRHSDYIKEFEIYKLAAAANIAPSIVESFSGQFFYTRSDKTKYSEVCIIAMKAMDMTLTAFLRLPDVPLQDLLACKQQCFFLLAKMH
jgi:hypothetical protein